MGKGIQLAGLPPETAAAIDDLKDQLLIVFLKRLAKAGQPLRFPIAEVDDTGQDLVSFHVVGREFVFELGKKS